MSVVRASSKYQIAIPRAIRSKLGIEPGQKLDISEEDGRIIITPLPSDPIEYLCGLFKGEPSMAQALLEERMRDLAHE
jgi:AbrB family looped-hinge helix DNA binding protein